MNNLSKIVVTALIFGLPGLASAGDGWTGFYLGAHVAATDVEASFPSGGSVSDNSTAYGLQAGYNHSLANNWVIGGELSYSTAEFTFPTFSIDQDTIRLKFKGGYDLGPALVYGILGYASADDGTDTEDGTTFGIGVNYKATDSIVLRAELLRDSFDFSGVDVDVTSLDFGVSYQF